MLQVLSCVGGDGQGGQGWCSYTALPCGCADAGWGRGEGADSDSDSDSDSRRRRCGSRPVRVSPSRFPKVERAARASSTGGCLKCPQRAAGGTDQAGAGGVAGGGRAAGAGGLPAAGCPLPDVGVAGSSWGGHRLVMLQAASSPFRNALAVRVARRATTFRSRTNGSEQRKRRVPTGTVGWTLPPAYRLPSTATSSCVRGGRVTGATGREGRSARLPEWGACPPCIGQFHRGDWGNVASILAAYSMLQLQSTALGPRAWSHRGSNSTAVLYCDSLAVLDPTTSRPYFSQYTVHDATCTGGLTRPQGREGVRPGHCVSPEVGQSSPSSTCTIKRCAGAGWTGCARDSRAA
ncbi:hypothetical protein CALCODRAFT_44622 [Calocera cornea HHB12733]|uniref:Uncharacterized protein n=1 Tax=Calocera cornea HHB12733 TaxID=1353952 RepID=A0A165DW48_9BASI|nr:hypothetical protein CALCODRAFT_44622 [Calocera cornea HHB12733]